MALISVARISKSYGFSVSEACQPDHWPCLDVFGAGPDCRRLRPPCVFCQKGEGCATLFGPQSADSVWLKQKVDDPPVDAFRLLEMQEVAGAFDDFQRALIAKAKTGFGDMTFQERVVFSP